MMLIPLFMNGFEKATTSSLSFVIVNGATASSASYEKVKEMIEACRNGEKYLMPEALCSENKDLHSICSFCYRLSDDVSKV